MLASAISSVSNKNLHCMEISVRCMRLPGKAMIILSPTNCWFITVWSLSALINTGSITMYASKPHIFQTFYRTLVKAMKLLLLLGLLEIILITIIINQRHFLLLFFSLLLQKMSEKTKFCVCTYVNILWVGIVGVEERQARVSAGNCMSKSRELDTFNVYESHSDEMSWSNPLYNLRASRRSVQYMSDTLTMYPPNVIFYFYRAN